MKMLEKLKTRYTRPKFSFVWLEMTIIITFVVGIGVGIYYFANDVLLPKLMASSSNWVQTDWSGGDTGTIATGEVTTWTNLDSIEATSSAGQITLSTSSGWSPDYTSWTRRAPIAITNSGVELANYQVQVDVSYDSDMQSDFDDLRFTNSSGTALDYFLLDKTDSTSATVWVEVDTIAASSDTTIYMYYGNAGASSASDASATFYEYIDFSVDGVERYDTSQDTDQNQYEIQDGGRTLYMYGNNWKTTNKTISASSGYRLEYEYKNTGALGEIAGVGLDTNLGITNTWFYQVEGSQNWGGDANPTYSGGGSWQTVGFTIGFTGSFDYIFYANDADGGQNTELYYKDVRIRKYAGSDPSVGSAGSEEVSVASSGYLVSNILDGGSGGSFWEGISYNTTETAYVSVKVRTQDDTDFSDAPSWSGCSALDSGDDMASMDATCVTDGDRYIQYRVEMSANGGTSPVFSDITLSYSTYDTTPPPDPSGLAMYISAGGREISGVSQPNWNSATNPYFDWGDVTDTGGAGLKGYCLYLGTDSGGEPETSKGVNLGTSPVTPTPGKCEFIVSSSELDLSTTGYLTTPLTTNTTYYLIVSSIDNADNVSSGTASFSFRQDSTDPTNVSYISAPTGTISNVSDYSFSWPSATGSSPGAFDNQSGLLGYQYQINSIVGDWKGTETSSVCGVDYIPADSSSHALSTLLDGDDVEVGSNVIYFQTIDNACRVSTVARTANLSYGGDAPSFGTSCDSTTGVTITPTESADNSFTLSWEEASAADSQTITNYYYMVNTSPPSSYSTITSNTTTYLDNGTATGVEEGVLTGAVKGTNTVYVVAVDDADNYSATNCLKGVFTLNSTLPDPPANLSVSDSSIKSSSIWRASLAWSEPTYTGTGALTYKIQRSTDNSTWTTVSTTTGTAYVDTVSTSQLYYWRVASYDTSAQSIASPTYATAVSLIPKGSYAEAPSLVSEPEASGITTKKASISWSTSRVSDSKVQYGTSSNSYLDEEPSNSTQVTAHSINLTGLSPGTTYYYRAKWTDEDGNTGVSDEYSFTTDPAPVVTEPGVESVGLDYAILEYTVTGASKVKIYYGATTAFGGTLEVSTSTSETKYTTQLTGLEDGTKYFYKINVYDSEDVEYEGSVLSFETLPRPKISTVKLQQVKGTSSSTVLVTWTSNTDISSIATYYPSANPSAAQDVIDIKLVRAHKALISGMLPNTAYTLIVKGRDKVGNEALSDPQSFTTATDTRPPSIANLKVEPVIQGVGEEATAQLVVSWDTDELSTSQVAYGEGSTGTLSSKSQHDTSLTFNHLVVIPNLQTSKVYHIKALSQDDASNEAESIDRVVITPKATKSALNLVVSNLSQAFGFLGNIVEN